ncbi:MAG: hypothetical protein JSV23_09115 [Promethearchaeota archaeon]|nr:MAG: hypothetical protein JSV23_09115 [Candidatus Lokiarchaeota archaeon]
MSENSELEKLLIESAKLEGAEIKDSKLKLIDKVIQEFAPEIAYLYQIREDESEEQQIKTGRLHENRILGIILKFYLEGKKKIKTGEVEREYKRYFKEIARSTISTYLNMLKKESTLYKERDGRIVYYIFYEDPPIGIEPFWFTRIFCIVPAYFDRANYFSNLYINAEKYVQQFINDYSSVENDVYIRNFKFITGLIILNIFKNRSSKCILCQFSKREIYNKLEEIISVAIKDRSDVLPEELLENVIENFSEIPMFNGFNIKSSDSEKKIVKEILRCSVGYKKDLDFQIMVSLRRKDLRLKQKLAQEEQNIEL